MNLIDRREAIRRASYIMGAALSAPAIAGVLQGCTAEPALEWTPQFLSENQAKLAGDIAQVIIPTTDTPGAKEAGVPQFIDAMVKEAYPKAFQDKFLAGLQDIDKKAESQYGKTFRKLEDSQKLEMLQTINGEPIPDDENNNYFTGARLENASLEAPSFFIMIKELTILGFCTSQVGAEQVLQYDAIPGDYQGCVDLKDVGGKTWAT